MPLNRFCLELRPFGNACPHACSFCYQGKSRGTEIMRTDVALKMVGIVLEHMSNHSFTELKLVFHGGEPAVDGGRRIFHLTDHIAELASHFSAIAVHYACHSSGFTQLEAAGFAERCISVCVNRHIPDQFPLGKRKIFRKNVERLLDLKLLSKQIIVLTKETLRNSDACLRAIKEYGIPTKLQPQFPSAPSSFTSNSFPNLDDMANFTISLAYQAREGHIDLDRIEPINRFLRYKNLLVNTAGCRFSDECTFSDGPIRSLALDPDGTIFPCNRFAGLGAFPLAHLRTTEVSVLRHAAEEVQRLKIEKGFRSETMKQQCQSCPPGVDNACASTGGCPFFSFIWKSSCTDPYCALDRQLYSCSPLLW